MEMMRSVLTLLLLAWLDVLQSISALLTCGDDKFWQTSTETCEPCSILCDPPAAYPTDCPKRCPNYTPRDPTPPSPEPADTSNPWWHIVIIILTAIVGLILIILTVCLIKNYWAVIQKRFRSRCLGDKDSAAFPVQEQGLIQPSSLNTDEVRVDIGSTMAASDDENEIEETDEEGEVQENEEEEVEVEVDV